MYRTNIELQDIINSYYNELLSILRGPHIGLFSKKHTGLENWLIGYYKSISKLMVNYFQNFQAAP